MEHPRLTTRGLMLLVAVAAVLLSAGMAVRRDRECRDRIDRYSRRESSWRDHNAKTKAWLIDFEGSLHAAEKGGASDDIVGLYRKTLHYRKEGYEMDLCKAAELSETRRRYEQTLYRFWEPLPRD